MPSKNPQKYTHRLRLITVNMIVLMTLLTSTITLASPPSYYDYVSPNTPDQTSTSMTHRHNCTAHTHPVAEDGLTHSHNTKHAKPVQKSSKTTHVHNSVIHTHKLPDTGFNHSHNNVIPDQQSSGLTHTHNCLVHTHKLTEAGLEHSHDISPPKEEPQKVIHTHNGVAHTHTLPEQGLKHIHNRQSADKVQSKVEHTHNGVAHTHKLPEQGLKHTHDIPLRYEKSSGITHTHDDVAHRHRLPEGKLTHVHTYSPPESNVKSKSIDGQTYSIDVSETHNTLLSSFFINININLKDLADECRIWQSTMRVSGDSFSYYPDIMAACSENVSDSSVRTDPIFIAEVLSPSTQHTDLVEKFNHYKAIPSLMEYVVISQDSPLIRVYRRRNGWMLESYYPEDRFFLNSVQEIIYVSDIYQRVRGLVPM